SNRQRMRSINSSWTGLKALPSVSVWRSSCGSRKAPRDRLWTAVWPPAGRGRVPAPPNGYGPDLGRCSPLFGERLSPSGRFAEDGKYSRRKPWRFYGAWAVTSARSAGGFRGRRLTLFRVGKTAIDAVFGKTGEYP